MTQQTDTDALEQLLHRVERLERLIGITDGERTTPEAASVSPAAFWALTGLQERLPEPGGILYAGSVTLPGGEHAEWQLGLDTAGLLEKDWTSPSISAPLAALGSPVRLRMLHAIVTGASSIGELVELEGVGTTGQVYHHVNQLIAAGWVRSAGRGRYGVPPERVVPLLTVLLASGGTA